MGDKGFDTRAKVMVLGNSGVGKTCLLARFAGDGFRRSFISTIGIDFIDKVVDIPSSGRRVKMQLWDTAGQERFRAITTAYLRGSHAVVVVYDVTDPRSFLAVEEWMKDIRSRADESVVVVLVGNKADVRPDWRRVSTEAGKELATKFKVPFFETSAKTDFNVDAVFGAVAEGIDRLVGDDPARLVHPAVASSKRVDVVATRSTKPSGCCVTQ